MRQKFCGLAPRLFSTVPVALALSLLGGAAGANPPVAKKAAPKPVAPLAATKGEVPLPTPADDAAALLASAPKASDFPNAAKDTLLDLSDITVHADGSARIWTRQAIKIFNKRGRDENAEIKIPYVSGFETVRLLRARTIKPDGTVIEVKSSEVRDSQPSDYDDSHIVSFSMPAVDDDCIIDYEYVTEQKRSQMPGQFWTHWYFQSGVDPVQLTRLTITAPKTLTLSQQIKNTTVQAKTVNLPDGTIRYTWQDRNVRPLEPEPMMPDSNRFAPILTVSTIPTWQTVADWYSGLARDRMEPDETVKNLVREVTAGKTTPEEKAKAIFYYVEEKTRYVAIELGTSAYQPRPAASVCANKYGDCKDMATLLVAMLREAGVKAYPVLLYAGSQEVKSDLLPTPLAFDHAICLAEIDNKKYWLDATAQFCAWGQIPSADRGAQGFVMRDGKGVFETIPVGTPDDNRTDQTLKLTLKPDGSATGTLTFTGTGDVDMSLRNAFLYLPPDKLRPYMEAIAENFGVNPRVTNIHLSTYQDKDTPVTATIDVTFPSWANDSDDVLIFRARPDQSKGSSSSPFREDMRRLPIAQSQSSLTVSTVEVTLPSGSSLVSVPRPVDLKSDLGSFTRTVARDGNKLTIQVRGAAYRADVPAFRYDEIRHYYDAYQKALDRFIVVKKP